MKRKTQLNHPANTHLPPPEYVVVTDVRHPFIGEQQYLLVLDDDVVAGVDVGGGVLALRQVHQQLVPLRLLPVVGPHQAVGGQEPRRPQFARLLGTVRSPKRIFTVLLVRFKCEKVSLH